MNRSLSISVCMAIVATLWILSGNFKQDEAPDSQAKLSQEREAESNAPDLFKVTVEQRRAETIMQRIDLQGEIEADRNVDVRAETEGSIESLQSRKGQRVSQGDALLRLAMNDRLARLARAKAALKVAQVELKSGLSLKSKKLLSENQHQKNQAEVMAAEAGVKEIELEIEHTRVQVPFDGILNELYVEQGDYVSPGTVVARVVDDQNLVIAADVPQQHIADLALGQLVEASLLDGTVLSGHISYISSSADPATRSFRIEAQAQNTGKLKRFGLSARVSIFVGEQKAHKLSPSLLSLNAEGGLQVKGLDHDSRVIAHSVEILRSENDGVWLTGLPEELELITVGQGFVSTGEQVQPVKATTAPATQGADS